MMMKFYKRQHEYYCGIDLHANSMHVCVVDHAGKKHVHKNFDTKKPETFLLALGPFRKRDLIIGCEATTLLKRECPQAKAFAERIEKKHNKARANTLLAIKLGRAVYWMWKRKAAFNPNVFVKG